MKSKKLSDGAKNNTKKSIKLTHEEVHEIYEEEVKTIYSSDQINTLGGTMGGARGTLGSTTGGSSNSILDQE